MYILLLNISDMNSLPSSTSDWTFHFQKHLTIQFHFQMHLNAHFIFKRYWLEHFIYKDFRLMHLLSPAFHCIFHLQTNAYYCKFHFQRFWWYISLSNLSPSNAQIVQFTLKRFWLQFTLKRLWLYSSNYKFHWWK